jgi:16S rRNA (cytosine1402-N4)-methyltransferase
MHQSVLLQETIEGLDLQAGDVVVDGTLGRGGHSIAAFKKEKNIFLIGIDRDEDAILDTAKRFEEAGIDTAKYKLFQGNFRDISRFVTEAGKDGVEKIMLDLGLSSPHLDSSGRGFSFKGSEPLLMTMEKEPGKDSFTAADIVNTWAEEDIANVIYAYGDERYSRRIAKAIVARRQEKPILTTGDLADIISGSVPGMYRRGKIHPATRTFQALRIAVNDELGSLKAGLIAGLNCLKSGGRISVISFHSLEDRIVKNFMRDWDREGFGKSLTKKPIEPSEEEIRQNSRSRSAKLRIFIKN